MEKGNGDSLLRCRRRSSRLALFLAAANTNISSIGLITLLNCIKINLFLLTFLGRVDGSVIISFRMNYISRKYTSTGRLCYITTRIK